MKYKYILLDWDGNLAQTLDIWTEAIRIPLAARGFDISDEEIGRSIGLFVPFMRKWGVKDPETAVEEASRIAIRKLPDAELYPDAAMVLETLHSQGRRLALITTSSHEHIEHLLTKHDLGRLFDAVITGDQVSHHKPHPEPLEKALLALGGAKELAVMIGDSDKDIRAAKSFGIDSILFYPPEHKKFYDLESLKSLRPTYVIDDFKDILKLV